MPLQDLTPQLRTRLSRMERSVGWFILLATVLLVFGFGYYIYNTAKARGWFRAKALFYTYAESGGGLAVGDEVRLMGFTAGRLLKIAPMPPKYGEQTSNNVYVEFEVIEPNFGYIWSEGSHVEFASSGLLDKRIINITKGTGGHAIYIRQALTTNTTVADAANLPDLNTNRWKLGEDVMDGTNIVVPVWRKLTPELLQQITTVLGGQQHLTLIDSKREERHITGVWDEAKHRYDPFNGANIYEMDRQEQVAIGERLQAMVGQFQAALPSILAITNQLASVLTNANQLTANLAHITSDARPMVSNLNMITANLTNPAGSFGEWIIPTNINSRLDTTLDGANTTITNLNTNLLTLNQSLENVANITSNLNNQVQANSNIVTHVSDIIVHSDEFIQGLKRFWLFRHLFAAHPAKKPTHTAAPARSPKDNSTR